MKHIDQAFVIVFARFKVFFAQMRKHTRDRCGCACAARHHAAQAHGVFFRQLGRRVAIVAIETKIAHACCFTQYQQNQGWFVGGLGGYQLGILPYGQQRFVVALKGLGSDHANGVITVERIDQIAQLGVVAHDGREILKNSQQRCKQNANRKYSHEGIAKQLLTDPK